MFNSLYSYKDAVVILDINYFVYPSVHDDVSKIIVDFIYYQLCIDKNVKQWTHNFFYIWREVDVYVIPIIPLKFVVF
jgi:hypothetical protein